MHALARAALDLAAPALVRVALARAALALASFAVLLAACGGDPAGTPGRVSHPVALAGTSWRLVSLGDRVPPPGNDLTIRFGADGRLSGTGGCNSFGGAFGYEAATGLLEIGDLASTKRACAEPARNQAEAAYLVALRGVTEAAGDPDGRLVLTGDGAELVFEVAGEVSAPPIEVPPDPAAEGS